MVGVLVFFLISACASDDGDVSGQNESQSDYSGIKKAAVIWGDSQCSSDEQIEFTASHFQYVLSGTGVGASLSGSVLSLNPDIVFSHYLNSTHISYTEPHLQDVLDLNDTEIFTYPAGASHTEANRIYSVDFNEWLINISNPSWTQLFSQWLDEIPELNKNAVFLDCASPILVDNYHNAEPENYSEEQWRSDMIALFASIREEYSGKIVFNGLHHEEGMDHLNLSTIDGGLIEGFVYSISIQTPSTIRIAYHLNRLIEAGNTGKVVIACSKSYIAETSKRLFAFGCYMLGSGTSTVYNFTDLDNYKTAPLQYYPEYDIRLGAPLDNPTEVMDLYDSSANLAVRNFENGIVIVNPYSTDANGYSVDGSYWRVSLVGGGVIESSVQYDGSLEYTLVEDSLDIPAMSAAILLKNN